MKLRHRPFQKPFQSRMRIHVRASALSTISHVFLGELFKFSVFLCYVQGIALHVLLTFWFMLSSKYNRQNTSKIIWNTDHTISEYACALSRVQLWKFIDCSPLGSSVDRIFQERILEWVAISSSRETFRTRN